MSVTIQFQSVCATNTTASRSGAFVVNETRIVQGTTPVPIAHEMGRRSKNGKLPRRVVTAHREEIDTRYRADMEEARVVLSQYAPKGGLAALRLSRGMSQERLATAIGVRQPHIAKIEAGQVNVYLETARRLATALGKSVDEISKVLDETAKPQAQKPRFTG